MDATDEYRFDGRYCDIPGRGSRLSKDYGYSDYYWYFGETVQIYLISAHWSHDSTTGIFDAHLNYTHENDIMTARLSKNSYGYCLGLFLW